MTSILPEVIVVHRGASDAARLSLAQTAFIYEGEVSFIHDGVVGRSGNLKCAALDQYANAAKRFKSVYQHRSVNDESYERFCFERWFIIAEYMQDRGIKRAIALDSDVLIYSGFTDFARAMEDIKFSSWTHCAVFDVEALWRFCDFVMEIYQSPDMLQNFAEQVAATNQLPVVHLSDMDFFAEFAVRTGGLDMNREFLSLGIDPNISLAHECVMAGARKLIVWRGQRPHVKMAANGLLVPFSLLHMQGTAKSLIPQLRTAPSLAEPPILHETMLAASKAG